MHFLRKDKVKAKKGIKSDGKNPPFLIPMGYV